MLLLKVKVSFCDLWISSINPSSKICFQPGMEYSYSYLYSYLLEYFFSVLSCTLYLVKFMSTCTRTYLSTVTKNPVLMSTTEYFLKFQSDRKKNNCFPGTPSSVSNAPHPSFSDL